MTKNLYLSTLLLFLTHLLLAQTATIRGNVYDKQSGDPVPFATVALQGSSLGTNTDDAGFFSISEIPVGDYTLVASYLGYESAEVEISLEEGQILYQQLNLVETAIDLEAVDVSAARQQARTEVQVSQLQVSADQIRALPATGGEPDIVQYLTVLPGIVVSGDQGGRLYIRGGSPVQNKVLLDGMTIYNPFHSIGFFSVFETETIRNVDVLTGGFNAEYGGRVSAVVDIKTREGNKKRLSGLVSASPFQAKALIEGPIKPLPEEGGNSISFILTGKHSYLDQSSKLLYDYAVDTSFFSFAAGDTTLSDVAPEDIGLPYNYTDLYGKLSFVGQNGSKLDVFGFNYTDEFNFIGLAALNWDAFGAGASFRVVPPSSQVVLDGNISFSDYTIMLDESDDSPRTSNINNYRARLDFTVFGAESELKYGFQFNGFNTDFTFRNLFGVTFTQEDFTTELAGYIKYKKQFNNLIIEPGLRLHFYASQSQISPEPRLGIKYNVTDGFRLKAAAGRYAQNLISTANDLDVVNFFNGFLAGPEETLFEPGTRTPVDNRLQTAWHYVAGAEIDVLDNLALNVEPYYKDFSQIININRNKLSNTDPDFVTETGEAYGIDFTAQYSTRDLYLWATYSLGYVNRFDGEQDFPTVFDRRHNVNFLVTYAFGTNNMWEASARWNFGSAFPFTQTQGFYENNPFSDLLQTDILTGNYPIGTLLSEDRNGGRLSAYHRMDLSLKRTFELSDNSSIEVTAAVTNAYDRQNIFYVDRITNNRVDQLPILPSLAATFRF